MLTTNTLHCLHLQGDIASQGMMRSIARQVCEALVNSKNVIDFSYKQHMQAVNFEDQRVSVQIDVNRDERNIFPITVR